MTSTALAGTPLAPTGGHPAGPPDRGRAARRRGGGPHRARGAGDEARVIFLVARISDDAGLGSNINARYTVESVEIEGLKEHEISAALRDRLQALVGTRLDPARGRPARRGPEGRAARLRRHAPHRARQRAAGGSASSSSSPRPRSCAGSRSRSRDRSSSTTPTRGGAACTTSRWGAATTASRSASRSTTTTRSSRSTRASASASRPGDIGTERVAASLEASWLNNTWRAPTLAALEANPPVPEPYASGSTVEPALTVALTRHVRASGGVSLSSLESLHQLTGLADGERRHRLARLQPAVGTATGAPGRTSRPATSCGRRSTGSAAISATRGTSAGRATSSRAGATAASSPRSSRGGITGAGAALRTLHAGRLGDAARLEQVRRSRPTGGNRVFHQSLEYRFYGAALFLDAGSVWDDGAARELRASTGFGFHTDHVFVTVAFPLDAPRARRGVHDGGAVLTPPARRAWRVALVALACAAVAGASLAAQSLTVRAAGDMLQVRGTGLRLIEGVVAEHLKDGRSVRVDFEMTILDKAQGAAITRNRQSFTLSFDLWEQRYRGDARRRHAAIRSRISPPATPKRGASKTCRSRSPPSAASPAISPSGSASSTASRTSRRRPPIPSRRSRCAR